MPASRPRGPKAEDVAEPEGEVTVPATTPLRRCPWCDLASAHGAHGPALNQADEPVFVVWGGPAGYPGDGDDSIDGSITVGLVGLRGLTLVPRKHVRTLTELPAQEMADVLAGLSRAAAAVRKLSGVGQVEIRTDLDGLEVGREHVHFHVEPVVVLSDEAAGGALDEDGRAVQPVEPVPSRINPR